MSGDNDTKEITIWKKLKEVITPLSNDEYEQLRINIIKEGCREPLIVWAKRDKLILVDGHNRYSICTKYDIPFKIVVKKFKDIGEVKSWMIYNQLGRRNLNRDQMSYYRGIKYEYLKKKKGGYGNVASKGQFEPSTSALLAKEFKTSESTIKRDSKFARGLNLIGKHNPKLKINILSGTAKVKKSDIILLADVDDKAISSIKNEADLHNKVNVLRNKLLFDIEHKLKQEKSERTTRAQKELRAMEPVFSNWDDRVKKVKGRIISAINSAIENRDVNSINNLKNLIEKLHKLLVED